MKIRIVKSDLLQVIENMMTIEDKLKSIQLESVGSRSQLSVDDQINDALKKLKTAVKEINDFNNYQKIKDLYDKINNEESKIINNYDTIDNKLVSNSSNLHERNRITQSSHSSGIASLYNSITSDDNTLVVGSGVVSMVPATKLVLDNDTTATVVSPVDDVRNEALQQLDTYLKKDDLGAALTSYKLLKALGSDKEADEYLKKYGYKVMEKDGDYIITKIEDTNPNNSNTNINKNQTETPNNSNNEVVAEEVASPSNNVSNTNTNQKQNVVRTNNVNNNQQSATNNPSVESNAANSTSSTPNDGQSSINKTNDNKTNKSNIVTIKDDTPTSTKKSSGIGTAIPVGLGTIAVGAAAVAGVRYAKNKKKDQEDYDENYDDENNDLDNDNEYVDSAQYNNDNDYTADDYLGPAGSNYTDVDSDNIEDDYVDPEELEPDEDEDLSSDIVLDQLNLNS